MGKSAVLFPGQGSQYVNMGAEFYRNFSLAREIFDMAEEVTKKPIKELCFQGPMEKLTLTANLQPAITAVNLSAISVLKKEGFTADLAAGHSLGEYSALYWAGVIGAEATLNLVNFRGEFMDREARAHPGSMNALMGLSFDEVNDVMDQDNKEGACSIANYNTGNQIVISGERDKIDSVSKEAKNRGAKAIPLKVSGAWHCELMAKARDDFKNVLEQTDFSVPQGDVLFNVTADTEQDPIKIKELMGRQICEPVLWYPIMKKMIEQGVDLFIEVGPKKVLQGLLKKIAPPDYSYQVYGVEDQTTLDTFLNHQ